MAENYEARFEELTGLAPLYKAPNHTYTPYKETQLGQVDIINKPSVINNSKVKKMCESKRFMLSMKNINGVDNIIVTNGDLYYIYGGEFVNKIKEELTGRDCVEHVTIDDGKESILGSKIIDLTNYVIVYVMGVNDLKQKIVSKVIIYFKSKIEINNGIIIMLHLIPG
jgi:hypothetical protein